MLLFSYYQIYLDAARVDILKYTEMYKQYKASLDPLDLEVLKEKRGQLKQSKKKRRQRKVRGKCCTISVTSIS